MKLHALRLLVPSDDGVLLADVQEKLRAMFDAKGIENTGSPAEDLAGPVTRARIHWPAADVLQHGDKPPTLPTVNGARRSRK